MNPHYHTKSCRLVTWKVLGNSSVLDISVLDYFAWEFLCVSHLLSKITPQSCAHILLLWNFEPMEYEPHSLVTSQSIFNPDCQSRVCQILVRDCTIPFPYTSITKDSIPWQTSEFCLIDGCIILFYIQKTTFRYVLINVSYSQAIFTYNWTIITTHYCELLILSWQKHIKLLIDYSF